MNPSIIEQLKQYFAPLESKITLKLYSSQHEKQAELSQMLEQVASSSKNIELSKSGEESPVPRFSILSDDQKTGINFTGIPGGHEFSSLILAILNADGKGKKPDEITQQRIKGINGPIQIRTYYSLSCTNCPDVVQSLNQMASLHENFQHSAIDGNFDTAEMDRLGVMGVPAVFYGDKLILSGKSSMGEIITALEEEFGYQEAKEDNELKPYDMVVVGGGPAGSTAALYSSRKGLKTALITDRMGGQVNDTSAIANLMSVSETTGPKLAQDLKSHLEDYDLDIYENMRINQILPGSDDSVLIASRGNRFLAKQVILATGASWRKLGVPGEAEYIGKGVAFCPHCDGPFFKDKEIAVVGGGNSGVEAAIDLAGICSKVTLIEFLDELKADEVLVKKLKSLENVDILKSTKTVEMLGDGKNLKSLQLEDRKSGEQFDLSVSGVFIQIGLQANSKDFSDVIDVSSHGEIIIDSHGRTSQKGIYAAGDVTTIPYKQIVISMGEGAKTSLAAFEDRMRS